MQQHGDQRVDDRSPTEDDGHHGRGCGSLVNGRSGPQREHQGECTQGTGDTRDQAPLNTHRGQTPIRTTNLQQDRRGDANNSISDADKQEGLQTRMWGFGPHRHVAATLVQDHSVHTPREHRQECENQPRITRTSRRRSRIHY